MQSFHERKEAILVQIKIWGCTVVGGHKLSIAEKNYKKCQLGDYQFGKVPVGEVPLEGSPTLGTGSKNLTLGVQGLDGDFFPIL